MYIRTKDGVYEIDKNTKGTEEFLWVKTNKANIVQCVWLNCITNQSENLEELCDEFVGVDKTIENGHQLLRAIPYKCANFWNGGVYGCIWTDKGLIYVAKMDSEGKLVLI